MVHGSGTRPAALAPNFAALKDESGLILRIEGEPAATYTVEASEDLITWIPLGTVSNPTGLSFFTDSTAFAFSKRFYRVIYKP